MQNQQKRDILQSTKGRFFTVTFIKKDKTMRTMNARLGVQKHLKGGVNTLVDKSQYITVFDVTKGAYRAVNLDTIVSIKTGEAEIKFS